jgi:lipoprotein-anchoring transpeptidase ErfK/SrfK
VLPSQPASAQGVSDFFESVFGGQSSATRGYYGGGRSGKRTVSFPKRVAPGQIVVSFADRRLYYIQRRGRAISYPIAAPRPQDRWQGTMRISRKRVNPPWTPTASMRRENPSLPAYVPGGHPRNPLGYRALYLGSSLYRIHGTDAPWTIGRSISKGCIRMYNADVADLYRRVRVGAKVIVNWKRYAGY